MAEHKYQLHIEWTGNNGTGTNSYITYERSHIIRIAGKPDILASSDIPFRGDGTKHNPEDLLLASLSSCHMLWYLHLCADAGIIVLNYEDEAEGIMDVNEGGGHFTEVILYPKVTVADEAMHELANTIHEEAHKRCFIANSVNFPVKHIPTITV